MDDLTQIKGIGPATAKRLGEAGIDTFARLAAAAPLRPPLDDIARNGAEAEGWIAMAKAKVAETEIKNTEGAAQQEPGPDAQGNDDTSGDDGAQASNADEGTTNDGTVVTGDVTQSASPGGEGPQGTNTTQSEQTGGDGNAATPAQDLTDEEKAALAAAGSEGAAIVSVNNGGHVLVLPEGMEEITVVGPKKGRWRAGLHFTRAARTVHVTPDQKAMIEADPTLSIVPADNA